MPHPKDENTATKDYSTIGYYGKPITDLSRDELLAALAELAEIYLRGMGDYNSLDTLEKLRFSTFFARFMRILESTYSRHMNNQLDPTIWRGWDEGLRDFYSHPGLQEWWSSRCHWFTPEFQELIVACIAEERDPTLYQSRI